MNAQYHINFINAYIYVMICSRSLFSITLPSSAQCPSTRFVKITHYIAEEIGIGRDITIQALRFATTSTLCACEFIGITFKSEAIVKSTNHRFRDIELTRRLTTHTSTLSISCLSLVEKRARLLLSCNPILLSLL